MDITAAMQRLIDAFWVRDYEATLEAAERLLDLLARADTLPEPETLRFSAPGQAAPRG